MGTLRARLRLPAFLYFFFFNDPATTEIYTLSLQRRSSDLVIFLVPLVWRHPRHPDFPHVYRLVGALTVLLAIFTLAEGGARDRKSTRLNSSHLVISYAVFCLKKKNATHIIKCTSNQMSASS